jgi:hypothetical protein
MNPFLIGLAALALIPMIMGLWPRKAEKQMLRDKWQFDWTAADLVKATDAQIARLKRLNMEADNAAKDLLAPSGLAVELSLDHVSKLFSTGDELPRLHFWRNENGAKVEVLNFEHAAKMQAIFADVQARKADLEELDLFRAALKTHEEQVLKLDVYDVEFFGLHR